MLVIRIELSDVFNKLLDRNGFHVIWKKKIIPRVTRSMFRKQMTPKKQILRKINI